jgi:hypothetical protein
LPVVALPVVARPLGAAPLPEEVPGTADVAEADDGTPAMALAIAPDRAPASAFSSSVRAADTGSVADCFAAGAPESSVLAVELPLAGAAPPSVVLGGAGAAASD